MVRDHSGWLLRNLPLERDAVAAGSGSSGIRRVARNPGWRQCFTGDTTARSSAWLYGLGRMVLGKQSCEESWPSSTTTVATSAGSPVTCSTTSSRPQIEHEVLRFSDPDKQAVLVVALKHFDSL